MRIRHLLLTGTGFALLSLAPIGTASAQDVSGAYQAFVSAQASGDADALAAAEATLREECIVAGFQSIDECVAAATGAGPASEPEPQAQEPAPQEPMATEPAPQEPVAEEPAPQEPVAEEPVPQEPVAEEPVPQDPVAEEPAPQEPVAEEPAPQEPVAQEPAPQEPVAEQPAPQEPMAEEPAPQEPVAQEPAPQEPVAEEPAPQQPAPEQQQPQPTADIGNQLASEIDIANGAIADAMSGGDIGQARATVDTARANIEALCTPAGYMSIDECLAAYGLAFPNVPNFPETPVEEPAPQQPAEQPAPDQPAPEQPAQEPVIQQPEAQPAPQNPNPQEPPVDPSTLPAEPVEQIENLPQGVTQEEVAPLLDSAKDLQVTPTPQQPPAQQGQQPAQQGQQPAPQQPTPDANQPQPQQPAPDPNQAQPQPVAPPPQTDAEAQSDLQPPQQIQSATQEQGQVIDAQQAVPQPQLPPDAQVVQQTNNNFVFQIGAQFFINNVFQDNERIAYEQEETYYERLPGGRIRETVERADGTQIVTIRDRNGNILRRSRITPDGREYILAYFDDRYEQDLYDYRDPGLDLPPLRLNIPARDYVLDASYANEDQVEYFFSQPPVEQVRRIYSIDEVKRSARIRDSVRRLEVGNLTFDSGAATVSRDQVANLSQVATAMQALLARNPAETFLIEGHTDAVGSDLSNLTLSDARAATVARILTDFYGIPPENLATQGYGERYLKINTTVAERLNRRVTIRRITPLITPLTASN